MALVWTDRLAGAGGCVLLVAGDMAGSVTTSAALCAAGHF